ncbi:MAG: agmatine deiminase family protein [Bacteroidales bacterium]|uniref:agmatine deiminase family protein n=1 Tax=Porphyromonas sp. TaxID=1924944 RepID=UPI0029715420|nr:agmatine deiminase family protein [Porphyromonas sp.]MDD7438742.1 agmatine deiminase family protein [Bacteroidales bacterium]MDY3067000.1 agmatine deiminase family protein [Porphyromonas sp.]
MELHRIDNGLIPEWHPQDAIILAWPEEDMDWAYILPEVRTCYREIIAHLLQYCSVVLLAGEGGGLTSERLEDWHHNYPHKLIYINHFPLNDTWMRDVMPLFGMKEGVRTAYDFGFNGWGLKFAANLDNRAVGHLFERGLFSGEVQGRGHRDFILEGGAIDVNSRGELLSTACVLREPNRNPSRHPDYHDTIMSYLGVQRHHMLEGDLALEGDDTDGHIDTLARFVADDRILYCYSEEVPQTVQLRRALEELRTIEGKPYTLIPLPLPKQAYDEEGYPLPATYANFLITNGAVLVPTYHDPMDKVALDTIGKAMMGYEVVGIDCRALVQQHGSLHCITMQVPEGFIDPKQLER